MVVPLPGDPCVSRSGFLRAQATRSDIFCCGDSLRTTSTSGALTTTDTGAKSALGS